MLPADDVYGGWPLSGEIDIMETVNLVFAAEWGEGQINWFVNGELFQTQTDEDWFTDSVSKDENPNAPFDQSFYLMLNYAVGGNYPENTNEMTFTPESFPSQLLIDWVRVYQCEFDGTTGTACMQDPI